MPPLDFDNRMAPGFAPDDEQIYAYFRRVLPDFYFINTPLSRMRKHLQLLLSLPEKPVQIEFARAPGARFTELFLCADDQEQPGLLSRVAGTLTANHITVHTAWIHTLRDPFQPDSGRKIVLDTLIVSENLLGRARALSRRTERKVADVLTEMLNSGSSVELLMMRRGTRVPSPLPISHSFIEREGDWTRIKLRLKNENGVLYSVTSALARLSLNVHHAQVNTFDNGVDDVFFVTRTDDQPLDDEEMALFFARLEKQLTG